MQESLKDETFTAPATLTAQRMPTCCQQSATVWCAPLSRRLHCRDWDRLNESAAHPTPAPWYPPSSRPADMAYIVASPPPISPRKPWEGTLRELPPHQQQLLRGFSPQHAPQQNQSGKPQHGQHTTPLPQGKAACRPSVQPQHSPRSPAPASRYSSPTAGDRAQHVDRSAPEAAGGPRQIDRAISAQEWEGFAVAAQLNGQDEGRSRQAALGPTPLNRRASGVSPERPQYLLLPEAESYDSFMLLAHAFRQWRSHAASEQTVRYAARLSVSMCILCQPCLAFLSLPVVSAYADMAQSWTFVACWVIAGPRPSCTVSTNFLLSI